MNAIKPTLTSLQCAMAALCGVQDAQDGRDMEASTLYVVGSKAWRAYYDAYQRNSQRAIMSLAELDRMLNVPVAVAANVVVREAMRWTFDVDTQIAPADQREDWVGE